MSEPKVHTYKGRPVADLSREEAIEALNAVGDLIEQLQTDALTELEAAVAKLRKNTRDAG